MAHSAFAMESGEISFKGHRYLASIIDLAKDDLRLYWKDSAGRPFKTIETLSQSPDYKNEKLLFATNSGIYGIGLEPLGLHIEEGKILAPLNLRDGTGNFYLKPGGVFVISNQLHASIVNAADFGKPGNIRFATQSGPLLLHNGIMNPQFKKLSANRKLRSGVGIINNQKIVFVLSEDNVTFYEFTELFAKKLDCRDALYLDGTISRMFLSGLHEDKGGDFVGIWAIFSLKPRE